jgi:hypothetical protein
LEAREKQMDELIRLLTKQVTGEDAESMPSVIKNVVVDTPYTEKAAVRLKEILSKVGKSTYDIAIKVIGDIATVAAKKWMGL